MKGRSFVTGRDDTMFSDRVALTLYLPKYLEKRSKIVYMYRSVNMYIWRKHESIVAYAVCITLYVNVHFRRSTGAQKRVSARRGISTLILVQCRPDKPVSASESESSVLKSSSSVASHSLSEERFMSLSSQRKDML